MHVARSSIVETLTAVCDAVLMDSNNLSQAEIKDIEIIARRLLNGTVRARNSLVPINQLPPEILGRIFHFLRPFFGDISSLYEPDESPNSALEKVAVVCHHWRIVAIGSPELWTIVDLHDDDAYVVKLLQRSGCLPLTLLCHSYKNIYEMNSFQEILERHMHRVGSLSLNTNDLHYFVEPAPSLIRAVLMGWYYDDADEGTSSLFGGEAPLLRELTLKAYDLPWRACHFPSITHLRISQGNSQNPGFDDDFFTMLEVCHRLQLLVIIFEGHYEPNSDTGLTTDNRVISLPDLRTFYLSSIFISCRWSRRVFSRVRVPGNCDLRLWGMGRHASPLPEDPRQPVDTLLHHLRSVSIVRIEFVPMHRTVHIACDGETLSLTSIIPSGEASLGFAEMGGVFEACRNLVVVNPAPSPYVWRDLLGALPSLQRLTIVEPGGSKGLSAVCGVLRQGTAPLCSGAPAPVLCSDLHSLKWHSLHPLPSDFWLAVDRFARNGAVLRNALVVGEDAGTITSVQRVSWDESGLADIQYSPITDGQPSGRAIREAHTEAVVVPFKL
ncbi:hypothetical protein EV715DRAFT_211248 [Schizophyllum commune]